MLLINQKQAGDKHYKEIGEKKLEIDRSGYMYILIKQNKNLCNFNLGKTIDTVLSIFKDIRFGGLFSIEI